MEQITSRIDAAREPLGLSITRLAQESRIPRSTLERRLAEPTDFTLGELERVATVLGTTPEALLFGMDAA